VPERDATATARSAATPEDAFDTLRRASQRLNAKLRKIAQMLEETGGFDDPDPAVTPGREHRLDGRWIIDTEGSIYSSTVGCYKGASVGPG
jgi:hypothetical protein